jgi:hypothetical protein
MAQEVLEPQRVAPSEPIDLFGSESRLTASVNVMRSVSDRPALIDLFGLESGSNYRTNSQFAPVDLFDSSYTSNELTESVDASGSSPVPSSTTVLTSTISRPNIAKKRRTNRTD